MATVPAQLLSEEEYLRIERLALDKSEYHDGQMFAMAGGSLNHSLIAAELIALMRSRIAAGCRIFTADLRIHIASAGTYTYADCGVICGEPEMSADQRDNLLNPLLIVEVLSPSTEGYDRGKKFELYRSIESLREYLIVHQDRRHVEYYSKQDDGSWILREQSGNGSLTISRLGIDLALTDLYASAIGI